MRERKELSDSYVGAPGAAKAEDAGTLPTHISVESLRRDISRRQDPQERIYI